MGDKSFIVTILYYIVIPLAILLIILFALKMFNILPKKSPSKNKSA